MGVDGFWVGWLFHVVIRLDKIRCWKSSVFKSSKHQHPSSREAPSTKQKRRVHASEDVPKARLPTISRRYSRLPTCATSLRIAQVQRFNARNSHWRESINYFCGQKAKATAARMQTKAAM